MANTEFFKKDVKTICNFLCRDELKVGTEVEVLRIILAWISNNGEGRYDVIDQLMRCVRFRDMSQKQLMECDNRVKAMGDIVLLYAYRSIVPRLMAEQLQDDVNVSSTGPRTCKTGHSDLESLLNILTSQEDVSSDVSEFEDDSDIDDEAQVQSKEKDLLQESMEILQEKMDILNARVWDNPGDISIEEFKKLPLRNADTSMDVAKESENIDKNRYKNILPYDYNRVKVTDCCNGSDYINASYMKMEMNGRKEAMTNYIATQGPLPQTSRCFWTMVWQEKAQRILMLTSEKESKIIKCYKYWPYYQCSSIHGDIHVTCTKEEGSASHLITRKFKLKNLKTKEERTVTQQQYVGWPGLGGPNDTDDFVDLLSTIRKETKGSKKPTIVHCSAGVGRTGVFITLDTAWSLMEAKQPVYPLEIIKELREQRTNCVQTVRQYEFICNAILKIYHEKFGTRKAQPEKRLSPWRRMFNRLRKTVCGCFGGQQEWQNFPTDQYIGVPMGTNCAPLLADLFLYSHEAEFIQSLIQQGNRTLAKMFNLTFRYIDDVLSLNNKYFSDHLHRIYPSELEIKDTTDSLNAASYLDLHLEYDSNDTLSTRIYDKPDDFNFQIVNFPYLCSNIPSSPAYGVYISQLIRYSRASSYYNDFLQHCQVLTEKLLRQGYVRPRLVRAFKKFYGRHHELVKRYNRTVCQIIQDILATMSLGDVRIFRYD